MESLWRRQGFQRRWTNEYFFIESDGKPVCQRTVSVIKEYNIKCHCESEHLGKFDCITAEFRKRKVSNFEASLIGQQNIFNVKCNRNESGVRSSYVVAKIIAKSGRPFIDSEFVKKCMLAVTEEVCRDRKKVWRHQPLCSVVCKAYRSIGSKFISTT
jgi:hypothetical protein